MKIMDEDPEEQDIIDWDLLERYHCKPVRKLSYEGFQIFVFPHNLAKYLPGWDRRYEIPESFPASKESQHAAGKFYDNYENTGSAVVAEKGEAGALTMGRKSKSKPAPTLSALMWRLNRHLTVRRGWMSPPNPTRKYWPKRF